MDPLYKNSEEELRDKLLQHECAFEENDWQLMEALLDEEQRAPLAFVQADKAVTNGQAQVIWQKRLKKWRWLLGLAALTIMTGLFRHNQTHNGEIQALSLVIPTTSSKEPKVHAFAEGQHALSTANLKTNVYFNTNKLSTTLPKSAPDRDNSKRVLRQQSKSAHSTINSAPLLSPAQPAPTWPNNDAPESVPSPAPLENNRVQPNTLLQLPRLPLLPVERLSLPLDSLKKPFAPKVRNKPKAHAALIVGVNANMSDYAKRTVSMLPHIGLSLSCPVHRNWTLQTDILAKLVYGYGFESELKYDVNDYTSNLLRIQGNNLFFVEMPVSLKYRSPNKQSNFYYFGVKPALVLPVNPSRKEVESAKTSMVSSANFNFDAKTAVDLNKGIRQFDLGLTLGFERRFNVRSALDFRLNAGLLDLSADNFFKNSAYHLNSDIQLSYRYYFR